MCHDAGMLPVVSHQLRLPNERIHKSVSADMHALCPMRDPLGDAPNTGANLMNRRFSLPYQFSGAKEMPRWSNARC